MLECSWNLGGCGAAIKRLSCGKRKRPRALCTIHTWRVGNSRGCVGLALDGFRGGPAAGSKRKSGKLPARVNLSPRGDTHLMGEVCPGRRFSARSDQNEIDQRDQGGSDANRDQGVVGAEIGVRVER